MRKIISLITAVLIITLFAAVIVSAEEPEEVGSQTESSDIESVAVENESEDESENPEESLPFEYPERSDIVMTTIYPNEHRVEFKITPTPDTISFKIEWEKGSNSGIAEPGDEIVSVEYDSDTDKVIMTGYRFEDEFFRLPMKINMLPEIKFYSTTKYSNAAEVKYRVLIGKTQVVLNNGYQSIKNEYEGVGQTYIGTPNGIESVFATISFGNNITAIYTYIAEEDIDENADRAYITFAENYSNVKTDKAVYRIVGTAYHAQGIYVNGKAEYLMPDGLFEIDVDLQYGENIVTLELEDYKGERTTATLKFTRVDDLSEESSGSNDRQGSRVRLIITCAICFAFLVVIFVLYFRARKRNANIREG